MSDDITARHRAVRASMAEKANRLGDLVRLADNPPTRQEADHEPDTDDDEEDERHDVLMAAAAERRQAAAQRRELMEAVGAGASEPRPYRPRVTGADPFGEGQKLLDSAWRIHDRLARDRAPGPRPR